MVCFISYLDIISRTEATFEFQRPSCPVSKEVRGGGVDEKRFCCFLVFYLLRYFLFCFPLSFFTFKQNSEKIHQILFWFFVLFLL
mgnify:CR=1 FL=1